VTSFVQEAVECQDIIPEAVNLGTLMPVNKDLQNLTDYFARPVAIANGDLTLGTTPLQFFKIYTSFDDVVNHFPQGQGRLTGVYGMRASVVYTLQVANTPFHQGLLCLNFQYGETDNAITYRRCGYSATSTHLPHVRLDLADQTMVQLKVPFLSCYEYAPLNIINNQSPPYGILGLNVLLPVPAITGMTAPHYQIYVHLEDIEFFGADPISFSTFNFQSGRRLAPVTEEFEKESHPFSSATMAMSRVARYVSKGVPLLSSIGGPTSWFLEKAAGTIRSFGFARPTITDPVMRMQRNDNINEHNTDIPSGSLVVGPLASNTLGVSPMFAGADVDEMSLHYIKKQPSQINRFLMDVSNPAGTLLYACPISPSCFYFRSAATAPSINGFPKSIATAANNSFLASNLFFFGQMFKFWRGGLKFKFTFAKAKLHGGRVMVNFAPTTANDGETVRLSGNITTLSIADYGTLGPNPFGYSAIFNLRDGNVFEFSVPYISPQLFTSFVNPTGVLTMHVVDALQAASVISTNISCLVEVSADDDFEFADARTIIYPAHIGGTPYFQSGRLLSQTPEAATQHTIGESINSVKQLIAIPKVTMTTVAATTKKGYTIPPWFYQPRYSVLTPGPSTTLTNTFSYGGNIATCYAFVKGGTEVHVYPNSGASSSGLFMSIRQIPYSANTFTSVQCPGQLPYSNNPVVASSAGALHARLPAYQHLARYFSSCLNAVTATGASWNFNATAAPGVPYSYYGWQSFYNLYIWNTTATTAMISRSASDDAGLGMFMGPPPLLLLSTNTAATLYDVDSDNTLF